MTIKFKYVEKVGEARPASRFDRARVMSGAPFLWHRWAPGPVYRLCVVQIMAIKGPSEITVRCFNQNAQLVGPAFDVELDDWAQTWSAAPSTVLPLPANEELGDDSCAVLCLSDAVIAQNQLAGVSFAKFPYAEDIDGLVATLNALRMHVSDDVFQNVLASNGIDMTELAA
jgi:hypothetical protein